MLLPAYIFPADQAKRESDSFTPDTGLTYIRKASGIWEQCGAHTVIIVVNIVTIVIDRAVIVYIRSVITIVARGTQPPPADYPFNRIPGLSLTAVISFYRFSSKRPTGSDSPLFDELSVHIVWTKCIRFPSPSAIQNQEFLNPSLHYAGTPSVSPS